MYGKHEKQSLDFAPTTTATIKPKPVLSSSLKGLNKPAQSSLKQNNFKNTDNEFVKRNEKSQINDLKENEKKGDKENLDQSKFFMTI